MLALEVVLLLTKKVYKLAFNKQLLEELYQKFNKREFVHPDPLEFLYCYDNIRDRELVGFIASSLAYGRVTQILRSVEEVLKTMHYKPYDYLFNTNDEDILHDFSSFKHRFTDGTCFGNFLVKIKQVLILYGSLEELFLEGYKGSDINIRNALLFFCSNFNKDFQGNGRWSLIPDPGKNSCCKRLNLFLRWMVRRDEVDPGGWDRVPKEKLIVPLDVHMTRFAIDSGITTLKTPNMRMAVEVTNRFREICPEDPVRYDFVITRPGIWGLYNGAKG